MRKFLFVAFLMASSLMSFAKDTNIALTCTNITASYTSSWNNLYSINNGTKGFGTDLPNNETWGCYISTAGNQAEQWLQYTWDKLHRMGSVNLYLWSDCQSGSGVAVPESWELLYMDDNGEWLNVNLKEDEAYGVERFEVNTVQFDSVKTHAIRILLHAQLNGQYYSAMGVNEWEVYGECIEEDVVDPDAKVNVAPMAISVDATYTSSWNNLSAINNGTKGTGDTLGNSETWGCYISESGNAETQMLTYEWEENNSVDSVSVYFWTNVESGNGVAVPESWSLEYYDSSVKDWMPATLLEGEEYTTERYEPNHVKFQPVSMAAMRLVLNAQAYNNDIYHSAMGVTEWEVFSAEMSYAQKLLIDYRALVAEVEDFMDEALLDIPGLYETLGDAIIEYEVSDDEEDAQVVQNAINHLKEILDAVKEAYNVTLLISEQMSKIEALLESETQYPGFEDLANVYNDAVDFIECGYGTPEEIQTWYEKLNQAIDDYRFSQLYSADSPADYSFLGRCFQFIREEAAPEINLEEGTVVYPNYEEYVEGGIPGDALATGWYLGETDGTQQVRWQQERMCWYAEKTGANDLTVNQNLTGLPAGYYAVSAEMITRPGKLNGQHIFAKTSAATAVSPELEIEGWDDNLANCQWTRLQTEKIQVFDGKLTIGADGPGDNVSDNGMFCVTNFILYYYGPTDEDNIEQLYNDKLVECRNEAQTMKYAADRRLYLSEIEKNTGATGYAGINEALKALNAAQIVAQRSIKTYEQFLVGPYQTLQNNIDIAYSGSAKQAAQSLVTAIDAANDAEDATYKNASQQNKVINYMIDSYIPVLSQVEQTTTSDADVKAAIKGTIDQQLAELADAKSVPTVEQLAQYVAQLQYAQSLADLAEIMAKHGTDYTALIRNASVTASTPDSWTVSITDGDGNGVKSGQHFDGKSGYYFDSYNSAAGKLKFTVNQTINNAPNGVYRLQAMMRVSAQPYEEGCYLYAYTDNDMSTAKFAPAHMQQHNYTKFDPTLQAEEGGDSIAYVSNTYGGVWEEAFEWLSGDDTSDETLYDYYSDIYEANSGQGYGWQYVSLQVEVQNHVLTVGVTSDDAITGGHTDTEGIACVPFSGNWFSADNFTLTLISEDNNEGWSPATGVENVENQIVHGTYPNGTFYDLTGRKVDARYNGIAIINGKKVFVR